MVDDMNREKERLKKLIEHWAQHNDEHLTRFKESAEEAAEMGLNNVSDKLEKASEMGEEISKLLRESLDCF